MHPSMSGAADPTLAFLERFENPKNWDLILPNVPLFIPHEREARGKKIRVDVDRLKKLAERLAEKEKRSGVVLRGTEGHTKLVPDGHGGQRVADQSQQPSILAYARNPKFGKWGPAAQPGLLVDLYVPKGNLSRVKNYPTRSLEFYPKELTGRDDDATGFAFLATDPALDMGMLGYARGGQPPDCLYYGLENHMADDLENREEEGREEETPDAGKEPPGEPGDPAAPPDAADEIDPAKKAEFMRYMAACYPHLAAMQAGGPPGMGGPPGVPPGPGPDAGLPGLTPNAAPAPAFPSPTNGALPMPLDKKPEPYARQPVPVQYERELKAAKQRIADLETKDRHKDFRAELGRLAQAHVFDPEKEFAKVQQFSREQFDWWVHNAIVHYERCEEQPYPGRDDLTGAMLPVAYETPRPPDTALRSEDEMDVAMQYMREHPGEATWEKALAHAKDPKNRRPAKRAA